MLANRSIPQCTVIPEIPYPDVEEAAAWLCKAFGFTVRLRIANHRIQLNVGDGAVILIEGVHGEGSSVMVRVADANSHYEQSRMHGAVVIQPPADYPYGERQYSVADFAGHRWKFTQTLADIAPADWGGTVGEIEPYVPRGH